MVDVDDSVVDDTSFTRVTAKTCSFSMNPQAKTTKRHNPDFYFKNTLNWKKLQNKFAISILVD